VEDFHTMWMPGYGSNAIQFFAGFIAAVNGKAKVDHSVKRMEFQNSLVLLEKGEPILGDRLICGDVAYVNSDVLGIRDGQERSVLQHQPA
jgi:hypothetical protein